jgi:hypothetical protein
MSSEIEFIQQRFEIVKKRLEDPKEPFRRYKRSSSQQGYQVLGKAQSPVDHPSRIVRLNLQREYQLLEKVLNEVEEGQVQRTLKAWRRDLGRKFADHRVATQAQREAFDAWQRLPPDDRDKQNKPEQPSPGAIIKDRKGHIWEIDERFLAMIDNLLIRLGKWLSHDDDYG